VVKTACESLTKTHRAPFRRSIRSSYTCDDHLVVARVMGLREVRNRQPVHRKDPVHMSRRSTALCAASLASLAAVATTGVAMASSPGTSPGTSIGPRTTVSPYVIPVDPTLTQVTSLLTVNDLPAANGYAMPGIPDGLGAYGDGYGGVNFISHHEFGGTVGTAHGPLATGAFISKWTLDPSTLDIAAGSDLITTVDYAGTTPATFSRWCSADLATASGLYNTANGKGWNGNLFMGGEENGLEGRAYAADPNNGYAWVLPALGLTSFENVLVASTPASDTTLAIGMNDTSVAGQSANLVYVGTKNSTGTSPVEKAGLTNGSVFGIKLNSVTTEAQFRSTVGVGTPAAFTLVSLTGATGAALQADAVTKGVFGPDRSEDGVWDPRNPNDFYFVTTGSTTAANGRGALWRMRFTDVTNPSLGGTLTMLVDHPSTHSATDNSTNQPGFYMPDNMGIDDSGHILIQEDPGNDGYLARIFAYDITTNVLLPVATFDPARFVTGGAGFMTQDEESSGIISVPALGADTFLLDAQVHATTGLTNLTRDQEHGQYLTMTVDFATLFGDPGSDVPEVPLSVLLSLSALVLAGGFVALQRRRGVDAIG
jgi:Bacterial protein of unknown function (DUF839)